MGAAPLVVRGTLLFCQPRQQQVSSVWQSEVLLLHSSSHSSELRSHTTAVSVAGLELKQQERAHKTQTHVQPEGKAMNLAVVRTQS